MNDEFLSPRSPRWHHIVGNSIIPSGFVNLQKTTLTSLPAHMSSNHKVFYRLLVLKKKPCDRFTSQNVLILYYDCRQSGSSLVVRVTFLETFTKKNGAEQKQFVLRCDLPYFSGLFTTFVLQKCWSTMFPPWRNYRFGYIHLSRMYL